MHVLASVQNPRQWVQGILQDLNVQQYCCENFLQIGFQGVGQFDPAWSQ